MPLGLTTCKHCAFCSRRPGGCRRKRSYWPSSLFISPARRRSGYRAGGDSARRAVAVRGGPDDAHLDLVCASRQAVARCRPPAGLAAGVSLLYALSVVLLIIVSRFVLQPAGRRSPGSEYGGALGLILLVSIVAILLGSPHYDLAWRNTRWRSRGRSPSSPSSGRFVRIAMGRAQRGDAAWDGHAATQHFRLGVEHQRRGHAGAPPARVPLARCWDHGSATTACYASVEPRRVEAVHGAPVAADPARPREAGRVGEHRGPITSGGDAAGAARRAPSDGAGLYRPGAA